MTAHDPGSHDARPRDGSPHAALERRLRRLHAPLGPAAGFDARLHARLARDAATEAARRRRRAQLERAYVQRRRALAHGTWLELAVLAALALAGIALSIAWAPQLVAGLLEVAVAPRELLFGGMALALVGAAWTTVGGGRGRALLPG